jgi:DHA2 family methylenomycin A resistance protein-like MFS transporter
MSPQRARVATLIATSLGFAIVQLDVTVVNVAVRQIGLAFGGGVSELQWVVGAYTLMFAALILSGGALADRFGARRVLLIGFGLFVGSSAACGLAPSIGVLIGARAVQGVGAALLGSCSLALLSHTFAPGRERARALGFWAAGASTALSGGPVVGGLLIAAFGWRSIFFINLPIGLVGLALTLRYAAETPTSPNRGLDVGGQLLAVGALASLAGAMIEAGPHGFANPVVLAGFAVAAVAASLFLLVERRTRRPMLPLALFRSPQFVAPVLVGLLVNVCFYGLIFVFSLLFQVEHGYSALRAGLAFLPMTAAIMAANLAAGPAVRRLGEGRAIAVGVVAMGIGCAGLVLTTRGSVYLAIVGQQLLLGAGLGLLVPPMTTSLLESVERSRAGVAAGTLNAMRQTGSLLGIALFGSLIAGKGQFFVGLHTALAISIAVLILAAALCFVLARSAGELRRPRVAAANCQTD